MIKISCDIPFTEEELQKIANTIDNILYPELVKILAKTIIAIRGELEEDR